MAVLVLFLIISCTSLFSQNVLHRNNYFIQEYLINPAFTGAKNFNPFYMSYRNQFSQLKERPQVNSASGYFILISASNISLSLYSSETPSIQQVFSVVGMAPFFQFKSKTASRLKEFQSQVKSNIVKLARVEHSLNNTHLLIFG